MVGVDAYRVKLIASQEEILGHPLTTRPSAQVEVVSAEGDTWGELAPKARMLVDTIEGEVARTNRRYRRLPLVANRFRSQLTCRFSVLPHRLERRGHQGGRSRRTRG